MKEISLVSPKDNIFEYIAKKKYIYKSETLI